MALIALGVTGGIGAYKAVEDARGLQKRGHEVAAIMTRSARRFVGEVTFEAITRRPVITDQYARGTNANIEHIALASDIGLLLVAPATANVIGKFANGPLWAVPGLPWLPRMPQRKIAAGQNRGSLSPVQHGPRGEAHEVEADLLWLR